MERFKTAKLFQAWITEQSEEDILKHYNVAPGILNQKLQIAQWLAYSAAELSQIVGLKTSEKEMRKIETRIKYGVRKRAYTVGLRSGIRRARARKLMHSGYKL